MKCIASITIIGSLICISHGRCGEFERIRVAVNESMAELYPRHIKAAIYYSIGMQEYNAGRFEKAAAIFRIVPPPMDAKWLTGREGIPQLRSINDNTASIKEIREYREIMLRWESDKACTPIYRSSMLYVARSLRMSRQFDECTTHYQSQNSQDMRSMFPDYKGEYWLFLEAKAGHEKDPTIAKVTWHELLKAKQELAHGIAQAIRFEEVRKGRGPNLARIEILYCESIYDWLRCMILANEQLHRENPEDLTKNRIKYAAKMIDLETKNSPEIPNDVRKLYRKLLEDHKELGKAYRDAEGKGFPDK